MTDRLHELLVEIAGARGQARSRVARVDRIAATPPASPRHCRGCCCARGRDRDRGRRPRGRREQRQAGDPRRFQEHNRSCVGAGGSDVRRGGSAASPRHGPRLARSHCTRSVVGESGASCGSAAAAAGGGTGACCRRRREGALARPVTLQPVRDEGGNTSWPTKDTSLSPDGTKAAFPQPDRLVVADLTTGLIRTFTAPGLNEWVLWAPGTVEVLVGSATTASA